MKTFVQTANPRDNEDGFMRAKTVPIDHSLITMSMTEKIHTLEYENQQLRAKNTELETASSNLMKGLKDLMNSISSSSVNSHSTVSEVQKQSDSLE